MQSFSKKKNEIDVNLVLDLSFMSVKLVLGIDEIFSTWLPMQDIILYFSSFLSSQLRTFDVIFNHGPLAQLVRA